MVMLGDEGALAETAEEARWRGAKGAVTIMLVGSTSRPAMRRLSGLRSSQCGTASWAAT